MGEWGKKFAPALKVEEINQKVNQNHQ